jgi:hypothetical protein
MFWAREDGPNFYDANKQGLHSFNEIAACNRYSDLVKKIYNK